MSTLNTFQRLYLCWNCHTKVVVLTACTRAIPSGESHGIQSLFRQRHWLQFIMHYAPITPKSLSPDQTKMVENRLVSSRGWRRFCSVTHTSVIPSRTTSDVRPTANRNQTFTSPDGQECITFSDFGRGVTELNPSHINETDIKPTTHWTLRNRNATYFVCSMRHVR